MPGSHKLLALPEDVFGAGKLSKNCSLSSVQAEQTQNPHQSRSSRLMLQYCGHTKHYVLSLRCTDAFRKQNGTGVHLDSMPNSVPFAVPAGTGAHTFHPSVRFLCSNQWVLAWSVSHWFTLYWYTTSIILYKRILTIKNAAICFGFLGRYGHKMRV